MRNKASALGSRSNNSKMAEFNRDKRRVQALIRQLLPIGVSTFLIIGLLAPTFVIGKANEVSNRRSRNPKPTKPNPNAKAPLPYRFDNAPSIAERIAERVEDFSNKVEELTDPYDLPTDFNRPEQDLSLIHI